MNLLEIPDEINGRKQYAIFVPSITCYSEHLGKILLQVSDIL